MILVVVAVLAALGLMQPAAAQVDSAFLPVNLGPQVNGPYDDILPVISPDGKTLYFCRSHAPENVGGGRQDIWYSEQLADGTWTEARNIGVPLNNRDNNYIEFKIDVSDLTGSTYLRVTDYSTNTDSDELTDLWDGLIDSLKEIVGS